MSFRIRAPRELGRPSNSTSGHRDIVNKFWMLDLSVQCCASSLLSLALLALLAVDDGRLTQWQQWQPLSQPLSSLCWVSSLGRKCSALHGALHAPAPCAPCALHGACGSRACACAFHGACGSRACASVFGVFSTAWTCIQGGNADSFRTCTCVFGVFSTAWTCTCNANASTNA